MQEAAEPPAEKVEDGQPKHEPEARYWPALQLVRAGQLLGEPIVETLQAEVETPE